VPPAPGITTEQDVNAHLDILEMDSPDVTRYAKENVNMMSIVQIAMLASIINVLIPAEYTTHVEKKLYVKHLLIVQFVAVQVAGPEILMSNVSNTNAWLMTIVHLTRLV
jgi:hypothetical protein